MDVVDTQVHTTVFNTDTVLSMMDAVGIQAVLIDDYLFTEEDGANRPYYRLANGAARAIGPAAEAAALNFPDRFSYVMRIDPSDPSLEAWVEILSASPSLRGLRAFVTPSQSASFEAGTYDRLFKCAKKHNLPMFVTCMKGIRPLELYIKKFSDLQFVIDHCGVNFDAPPGGSSMDDALYLAQFSNVAIKWAHAPNTLSVQPYPFPDLEPKLRRTLDAFGRERIMWASDFTMITHRLNWAEQLFWLRHSPTLSESDKEWILGRTARTLLRWPPPEKVAAYAGWPPRLHTKDARFG